MPIYPSGIRAARKGKALFELWIVNSLQLPCDNSILNVDHPAATAGAVVAVSTPDGLVILPPVPVTLFPPSLGRIDYILDPCRHKLFPSLSAVISPESVVGGPRNPVPVPAAPDETEEYQDNDKTNKTDSDKFAGTG